MEWEKVGENYIKYCTLNLCVDSVIDILSGGNLL